MDLGGSEWSVSFTVAELGGKLGLLLDHLTPSVSIALFSVTARFLQKIALERIYWAHRSQIFMTSLFQSHSAFCCTQFL